MTPRQLRLLRGAAASSAATIIAAVSHTIGGGAPPHPLLVIALSVFLTPLAALLVGRTARVGRLSIAVTVSQAVFHVLFVALGAVAAPLGAATSSRATTSHHHSVILDPLSATVAPDAGMLGAHILAAALTIAMLWRGEQLIRGVARWVHALLLGPLPRLHADWPIPPSFATEERRLISNIRTGDISRRGPPVFSRG